MTLTANFAQNTPKTFPSHGPYFNAAQPTTKRSMRAKLNPRRARTLGSLRTQNLDFQERKSLGISERKIRNVYVYQQRRRV